jgi:hypothetical protein
VCISYRGCVEAGLESNASMHSKRVPSCTRYGFGKSASWRRSFLTEGHFLKDAGASKLILISAAVMDLAIVIPTRIDRANAAGGGLVPVGSTLYDPSTVLDFIATSKGPPNVRATDPTQFRRYSKLSLCLNGHRPWGW